MSIPNDVVDRTDIASTSIGSPTFGVVGGGEAMEMWTGTRCWNGIWRGVVGRLERDVPGGRRCWWRGVPTGKECVDIVLAEKIYRDHNRRLVK